MAKHFYFMISRQSVANMFFWPNENMNIFGMLFLTRIQIYSGSISGPNTNTGCPILKFTFSIYWFLSPLILLRDCSVLEIYVFISLFKRSMFENSSMFPFQDMTYSIEYSHFRSFNTPNFDGSEKLRNFNWSWIRSNIILFGVYMF